MNEELQIYKIACSGMENLNHYINEIFLYAFHDFIVLFSFLRGDYRGRLNDKAENISNDTPRWAVITRRFLFHS